MNSRETKRKTPLTTIEMDENGALVYKENTESRDDFLLHANSTIEVSLVDIEDNEVADGKNLPGLFEERKRDKDSILLDRRIIKTYKRISSMRDIVSVDIKEFLEGFVNTLLDDAKLAYRVFRLNIHNEGKLNLYLDHVLAINVASLSILSEVDEDSAIDINLEILKRGMVLSFETETSMKENLYSMKAIMERYPRLATRFSYVDCLCKEDGYGIEATLINGKLRITYEIMEATAGRGMLHQAPLGQLNKELLLELLSVFFY